jgi:HAD superfamily hydrolase (TIGR01459 family)
MSKTKFCQGISDISDSYSSFIIDQWGVLHNGESLYDGVLDCLQELKKRNKYVIILSNQGRRADESAKRLKKLGVSPDLYNNLITAGELTWQGLHEQSDDIFGNLGQKCFLISRGDDKSLIDGLDIEVVDDINDAEFLLISGSDAPKKTLIDYYEPILKSAIRKRLKAICANPDSRILIGNNHEIGPGIIARRYEDFGGVVHYIGKPHKPIFNYCIRILQENDIYPGQTVMIGDTVAHDIIGASLVNMDTCLVKNGIHYGAFKNCHTPMEVDRALNTLVLQYNNAHPTYLVNRLHWGKALPDRKHKKKLA